MYSFPFERVYMYVQSQTISRFETKGRLMVAHELECKSRSIRCISRIHTEWFDGDSLLKRIIYHQHFSCENLGHFSTNASWSENNKG